MQTLTTSKTTFPAPTSRDNNDKFTVSQIEEWACGLLPLDKVAIYPATPPTDTQPARPIGRKFLIGTVMQKMPAHLRIEPDGQKGIRPQSVMFRRASASREHNGKCYCLRPVPRVSAEAGGEVDYAE